MFSSCFASIRKAEKNDKRKDLEYRGTNVLKHLPPLEPNETHVQQKFMPQNFERISQLGSALDEAISQLGNT
jgi:hypothetical protein